MTMGAVSAVVLATYCRDAELVGATTPIAHHSTMNELRLDRSYIGAGLWPGGWTAESMAGAPALAMSIDISPNSRDEVIFQLDDEDIAMFDRALLASSEIMGRMKF